METVTLSSEQQALFDYIEGSENNIFVTGRAGTGKALRCFCGFGTG